MKRYKYIRRIVDKLTSSDSNNEEFTLYNHLVGKQSGMGGFFAATIGVGLYSDVDLIGSLCLLMARGAIISMFVVIFIMPSMYMLLDKLICKTTLGLRNTVDV